MGDDQTLSMYSGHPMGLFPSHANAPRVVITNGRNKFPGLRYGDIYCNCLSNFSFHPPLSSIHQTLSESLYYEFMHLFPPGMVIPNYSSREKYEKMFALGVTMYGQMTAGSYCYIGPQVTGFINLPFTYPSIEDSVQHRLYTSYTCLPTDRLTSVFFFLGVGCSSFSFISDRQIYFSVRSCNSVSGHIRLSIGPSSVHSPIPFKMQSYVIVRYTDCTISQDELMLLVLNKNLAPPPPKKKKKNCILRASCTEQRSR